MNERLVRKALSGLPLGGLRYFEQTGSTNDVALAWAASGSSDLALVYAEQQTAGRGRGKRSWFTPPGAALAFSLILRPQPGEEQSITRFSGLGALAVCEALVERGLQPEIKWPNDVLLGRRKVCGILVESVWTGDTLDSLVLGVGINVKPEALPPTDQLTFPGTCLEAELASSPHPIPVDRPALLRQILLGVLNWRRQLATEKFLQAWETRLAFRGEQVEIWSDEQAARIGQVTGLETDGSLRLLSSQGDYFTAQFGEVHLRPVV